MQGASAIDPVDGDVTSRVDACAAGFRFARYGLQGCKFDTSKPGTFTVTFAVRDSASSAPLATVSRTVVVLPKCYGGEFACDDNACSHGGICLGSSPAVAANSNSAPRLVLRDGDSSAVYVPYGTQYAACGQANSTTRSSVCERGVLATDAEDGSLTAKVLACPPASCLAIGCPGHEFVTKGAVNFCCVCRAI